jgi:hypothetical protein
MQFASNFPADDKNEPPPDGWRLRGVYRVGLKRILVSEWYNSLAEKIVGIGRQIYQKPLVDLKANFTGQFVEEGSH